MQLFQLESQVITPIEGQLREYHQKISFESIGNKTGLTINPPLADLPNPIHTMELCLAAQYN
jgi:hypothetical protein